MSSCCPVVELRQYTLRQGQRDVLIELFDREFIESQEAVGMEVIGQFRDLDRPERFVWMRGFPDMSRRREALEAFYGGPIWKAHAAAANATMIDVDDVLLLRPVAPSTHFEPQPQRPGQGADVPAANFAVTIWSLSAPADHDELTRTLLPALAEVTPPSLATFVEEPSENTFPALPVRTGEHVVVSVQRVIDDTWPVPMDLNLALVAAPLQLRLAPTARSRLR
jgi:NIPSNAP